MNYTWRVNEGTQYFVFSVSITRQLRELCLVVITHVNYYCAIIFAFVCVISLHIYSLRSKLQYVFERVKQLLSADESIMHNPCQIKYYP